MNLKRILCYFVFVCVCFSLLSTLLINAQDGIEVNVYDASGKSSVMQINEGKSAGFLFNAAESFDSVSSYATKIGSSKGSVQVSLYKYNESYHKTIKSQPIMTQSYTDIKRNAVLSLSGTVCSSGEYLIVFHNVENKVGIYTVDGNRVGGGLLYEDGYEVEGTLKASVHFTKTANKYFNEYKSSYDLSYTVTTPEEYQYSSDDAMIISIDAFGVFIGRAAPYFISLSVGFFAFATIICWSVYGAEALRFLLEDFFPRTKRGLALFAYRVVYSLSVLLGSVIPASLMWELSDLSVAVMTVINCGYLLYLSGEIKNDTDKYFLQT